MPESEIMRAAWTALVRAGAKIWRNNVGTGVVGKFHRNSVGEFHVQNGRLVKFGLCEGSPDLVGFVPVVITPTMVGKTVAIFVGAEAKDPRGTIALRQSEFLAMGRSNGAICFIFRSADEAASRLETQIDEFGR